MTTVLSRCVRVGLLSALALAVIAGHSALARLLLVVADLPAAAAGVASTCASLIVFLVTGIFLLPRARRLAGASADAVTIAIGTALACVAARAAFEGIAGGFVGGLPLPAMALAAALVAAASPSAVRRRVARPSIEPPVPAVDRSAA